MYLKPSETALLVKITHSRPIEIKDFVATMSAVGSLFDDFCRKNGDTTDTQKARLYVEKIEHGSIEILLTEAVTALALPFMENMNIIMEFAAHLRDVLTYFATGMGSRPELDVKRLNYCRDVFAITAGDRHGTTEIGAVQLGTTGPVYTNCIFNYRESNLAQNHILRQKAGQEDGPEREELHARQLMTIFQMRGYGAADTGNKAVIDHLHPRPLPVVFETDELKRLVLGTEENPTRKAFLVDVVIQTIGGKPAAFKVMALHDSFPLGD